MVFEWLHMPSEHGYNRMRHLSRTPPEYWSKHDRYYSKWDRSKYFRARNKEYSRHGGARMTEAAQRRFHARFPGGDGFYFPYAEPLHSPFKEQFREMVDRRRHVHKFWQDYHKGRYGNPLELEELWVKVASHNGIDPQDEENTGLFMSFVELKTGRGVQGPLGWGFRGDRPNEIADEDIGDPWWFNRNGRSNGPIFSGRGHPWLGLQGLPEFEPDDFFW